MTISSTVTSGASASCSNRPPSILVVDDAAECRRFISWALKKSGAIIDTAADGAAAVQVALAAIESGLPYDLIVSDIEMPRMNGYEMVACLRRVGIRTPIIALTAHETDEDRSRYLSAGFDNVITKPIRTDALLLACNQLLLEPGEMH